MISGLWALLDEPSKWEEFIVGFIYIPFKEKIFKICWYLNRIYMYRKIIYVSFNFHNSSRTFLLKRPCRATSMKLHFYRSMKEKINHSAATIWCCLQKMYSRKQEMFKAITSTNISQHHSQTPDVTRVSAFEPATAHYLSHNLFRPII